MAYIDRFRMDNKVALVSGGSRGIGEAICHGLAEQGAHVIVASRRIESCEKVAQDIRDKGFSAEAKACHMGEVEAIEGLMAEIEAAHGRLDALVNCGATNPYFGATADTPVSAFDKTVEVNFRGPFLLSSAAVKMMAKNGGGSILNVASVNGVIAAPLQGVYSQTKAAVISMTQSFAQEYGPVGVRVNALCPGLVETKLASALTSNEELVKMVTEKWPLRRTATPDEMVGPALYMLSEASSFMTGQALVVDGGALISAGL